MSGGNPHRAALYFSPAPGTPLFDLGTAWLGRDHATGEALMQPELDGIDPNDLHARTSSPRRYGFHATLKAPFRLAPGRTVRWLRDALKPFAAARSPFAARMEVGELSGFVAVVLAEPSPRMQELADDVVRGFDLYRAPLSDEERAKRQTHRELAPDERERLERWGYHHVFEGFTFHMTLSNRLEGEALERTLAAAREWLAPALAGPIDVDALALYEEATPGADFVMTGRYGFKGVR